MHRVTQNAGKMRPAVLRRLSLQSVLHGSEADADGLEVGPVLGKLAPAQLDAASDEVGAVKPRQVGTEGDGVVAWRRHHSRHHLCTHARRATTSHERIITATITLILFS